MNPKATSTTAWDIQLSVEYWAQWMGSMAWQVCLLVLVIWVITRLMHKRSARLRYALWLIVPLRLVLPPTLTLVTGWGWWMMPATPSASTAEVRQSQQENSLVSRDDSPRSLASSNGSDEIHSAIGEGTFIGSQGRNTPSTPNGLFQVRPLAGHLPADRNRDHLNTEDQDGERSLAVHTEGGNKEQSSMLGDDAAVATFPQPEPRGAGGLSLIYGLFFGWLAGVLVLISRLFLGYLAVRRLAVNSRPANADLQLVAEQCGKLLGMNRKPAVRVSAEITGPMLSGLLHPIVLLPERIEAALNRHELLTVMVHEMHHAQRRDPWVRLAECLIATIYWFHPAVWFAIWNIGRLREQACDEGTIAALGGHRKDYGQSMVKVASLMATPQSILGLSFVESRSLLTTRVNRILDPRLPFGRRLSWPAIAGVLGVAMVVIPGGGRPANEQTQTDHAGVEISRLDRSLQADERNQDVENNEGTNKTTEAEIASDERTMRVTVVDPHGQPLEGVKIFTNCSFMLDGKPKVENHDYFTDENGDADVLILAELNSIRTWASKEGYVSLFFNWERGTEKDIPERYPLTMQPGTILGGTVVDPDGTPVAGARVEVVHRGGGVEKVDTNSNSRITLWLASGNNAAMTDEKGKWSIVNAPAGDDLQLEFMITHPDFLADERWQSTLYYRVTLVELRNQTARFMLKTGNVLSGQVTDSEGNPVVDALVIWGDHPYGERGSQETRTGEDGHFRVPPQPDGEKRVTVVAEGWMPQTQMVKFGTDQGPLQFSLVAGKKLHLKFVDPEGNPLQPQINIDEWRGSQALYNTVSRNVLPSGIPRRANEDGEYTWEWAPDDAVQYTVHVTEWNFSKKLELVADGSVHTFTLSPPFVFHGTVANALTREPVSDYQIVPVYYWSTDANARGIIQRGRVNQFDAHEFHMDDVFSAGDLLQVAFRFHKPGYEILTTSRYSVTDEKAPFDIRLVPVPIRSGRALLSDGRAAPNARVWLVLPDESFFGEQEYSSKYSSREPRLSISEDGTFEYPTPVTNHAIVVASDEGYAENYMSADESAGDMVLQPWARIEGQLFQDGNPVPDAIVFASPIRQLGGDNPHVQDHLQTRTDIEGRFVFDRVPPVPCGVCPLLSAWGDFPITSARTVPLELQPGKTHVVDLGGDGLRITGNVKLEGVGAERIEFRYGLNTLLNLDNPISVPDHARNKAVLWKSGKLLEFEERLAAGLQDVSGHESHFVKLNPDGSFLINGVQSGNYRFLLKIYEPPSGCLIDPVGYGFLEFATGDYPVSDNTIDLGTITIPLEPMPQVGDILPDFQYRTMEGDRNRISDLRGRKVIIDFWATWCAPCVAGIPDMVRLHERLNASELGERAGEIELISISIDDSLETVQAFLADRDLRWPQGHLGSTDGVRNAEPLGVNSVPLWIILDEQGAIELRTPSLEEVRKHLSLD